MAGVEGVEPSSTVLETVILAVELNSHWRRQEVSIPILFVRTAFKAG